MTYAEKQAIEFHKRLDKRIAKSQKGNGNIMAKKASKKTADKKTVKKTSTKVAKKSTTKEKKFVSKSGNYKNVRHLMETLLKKNASISYADAEKIVKNEFPMSKYAKPDWSWYRNKIVSHNEWRHVEPPKHVPTAKIKKTKK